MEPRGPLKRQVNRTKYEVHEYGVLKASRREAFNAGGLRERGNIKDIVGIMFYCFASTPAGWWCFFGVPEKSSRSLAMTGCGSAPRVYIDFLCTT